MPWTSGGIWNSRRPVDKDRDSRDEGYDCRSGEREPWFRPADGKAGERNDEPGRRSQLGNEGKTFRRDHLGYGFEYRNSYCARPMRRLRT